MDIASLAGMLLGVVMFLFGVFSSGGASGLFNMFDFPSIIITLGGYIGVQQTSGFYCRSEEYYINI